MGEMADYYIDRQLNRHMNPEREIRRYRQQEQNKMESMSDKELLEASEKALKKNKCNEKFTAISKKIVEQNPEKLSEKQRNCLYGLLGN